MRILSEILDRTIETFALLGGILSLIMMLGVFIDVCLRFFFNKPSGWVVEYAEYSLLFITFLSAAWVLRENRHVKLDLVLVRLKPKNQRVLNCLTSALGGLVFLIFTWYAATSTWHYFEIDYRMATSLRTLKWPIMSIIPVGSLLVALQFIRMSVHSFQLNEKHYSGTSGGM